MINSAKKGIALLRDKPFLEKAGASVDQARSADDSAQKLMSAQPQKFPCWKLQPSGWRGGHKHPTQEDEYMRKIYFLSGLILTLILISGCVQESTLEEYCTKLGTGEKLSLSEAKEIAMNSECVKEGALKKNYFCNEDTGTWWIDLDIQKELCNPTCVINVATKEAVINWRCTGAIPE